MSLSLQCPMSDLYVPTVPVMMKGVSVIKVSDKNAKNPRKKGAAPRFSVDLVKRESDRSTGTEKKQSVKEQVEPANSTNGVQTGNSERASKTIELLHFPPQVKEKPPEKPPDKPPDKPAADSAVSGTVIGATPPVLTAASPITSGAPPAASAQSASQLLSEQIGRGASPPTQPLPLADNGSSKLPTSVQQVPENQLPAEGAVGDRQRNLIELVANSQLHDSGGINSRLLKL